MNRIKILLYIFFLGAPVFAFGQTKIFRQSGDSDDAFRVKVVKNDTIVISEDSAYVYSIGMVEKISDLEQRYLSSLNLRDNDLKQIGILLKSLNDSYSKVQDLIRQSNNINKDQVRRFQDQISKIISNLGEDVHSLEELENRLQNSRDELLTLKKEIRNLRHRLWWKRTGGIIVAAAAGLAAGIAIASF